MHSHRPAVLFLSFRVRLPLRAAEVTLAWLASFAFASERVTRVHGRERGRASMIIRHFSARTCTPCLTASLKVACALS